VNTQNFYLIEVKNRSFDEDKGGYVIDNCSSRMLNFSGTTEKHPEV
jgi:hypothetical protein